MKILFRFFFLLFFGPKQQKPQKPISNLTSSNHPNYKHHAMLCWNFADDNIPNPCRRNELLLYEYQLI